MSTVIENYLSLRNALINEKARIEARLSEIVRVLGTNGAVAAPAPSVTGGKRTFSEATKAKMRAAQQARWAKKGSKAEQTTATTPKKREMSPAGRAAVAAAAKARWAKAKAAGKTTLAG